MRTTVESSPPGRSAAPFTFALRPLSARADRDLWQAWTALAWHAPASLRPDFLALERPLVDDGEALVWRALLDDPGFDVP